MSDFKVGDTVRITGNVLGSRNKVGDVGVVTEERCENYRVEVEGGPISYNWSSPSDLELFSTSRSLTVGQKYTSKNGAEWECIFVRDGKAWLAGVKGGAAWETAYVFNLDGVAVSLFADPSYDIAFEPVRETVTLHVNYDIGHKGMQIYNEHDISGQNLIMTFETLDGAPDWSTAKVTPCE